MISPKQLMKTFLKQLDQVILFYIDFTAKDKTSFDSMLSINLEDDRSSSLSLKSEYEVLFELLSYHTINIENIIKQQNFSKDIFLSIDNPNPDYREFWNSGILFNVKSS